MEKKTTPCECPIAGYCSRHKITKNAHFHNLCRTRQDYFEMYENCMGPGQEFTNCDGKTPEIMIPAEPEQVKEKTQEPKAPSLWQQAKNLAKATVKHVATGAHEVSTEVYEERLKICDGCEFHIKSQNRCAKCGCWLKTKCKWKTSSCPIGKWSAQ